MKRKQKMKSITLDILEHGTMLADYFSGTSGVQISIYCDKNTIKEKAIEMIEEEINSIWDHVESVAEHHEWSEYSEIDLGSAIDEKLNEMREYIKGKEQEKINPGLDFSFEDEENENDDLCDYPVTIFTIEFTIEEN